MGHSQPLVCRILPAFRNCHFYHLLCACVDRIVVHLYDGVAFSSVGSFCSGFHQLDGLLLRNNIGKLEERGLENCIDTSAKTDFLTDLNTVNHIELNAMIRDKALYLARKVFLKSFCIPRAVQQEGTAVYQLLNHVVFIDIRRIMTCHEVCLLNQVRGLNRTLAETQVGHGNAA